MSRTVDETFYLFDELIQRIDAGLPEEQMSELVGYTGENETDGKWLVELNHHMMGVLLDAMKYAPRYTQVPTA